ncbi:MAG: hypothetical protein PUD15_01130 [Prevotella sp.]|nr:hypothetical protein [Prevotella sp.]
MEKTKLKISADISTLGIILGKKLGEWRVRNGYSFYAISKEEKIRIENIQNVERGGADMRSLLAYFEFVAKMDKKELPNIISDWCADILSSAEGAGKTTEESLDIACKAGVESGREIGQEGNNND